MSSYAVYQIGYCIFGVGETPDAARSDAAQWMKGEGFSCRHGKLPSVEEAKAANPTINPLAC